MSPDECHDFIQYPFHKDAIQLRYWDDLGKRDVVEVPSLFEQKVPFNLLGEALFGAISLANPSWADVHPT